MAPRILTDAQRKKHLYDLPYLQAFGYSDFSELPVLEIMYPQSDGCIENCKIWSSRLPPALANYFAFPGDADPNKPYTPMVIDLTRFATFDDFVASVKDLSQGMAIRLVKKATKKGYFAKRFAWRLHIPDIVEINTSKDVRSGGAMSVSYRRTVDEMGGAPTAPVSIGKSACNYYWGQEFGTFQPAPGHVQGSVQTDERLVAYIALRRYGDFALYSMILGHGAHLSEGIMDLLHHTLVKTLIETSDGEFTGLKYLVYGGMQNGGEGLFKWKRRAGFKPFQVQALPTPDCPRKI